MTRPLLAAALVAAALLSPSLASAAPRFPYSTTISAGDLYAARIAYGDHAAAGIPGRDAIPMFPDVAPYDDFYSFDDDKSCDETCVRHAYARLRRAGAIELVSVGQAVAVLGTLRDPKDPNYLICRVRFSERGHAKTRLVTCVALLDQP